MSSPCDTVAPKRIIVFELMSRSDVAWACFSVLAGKAVLYIKKPRGIVRPLLVMVLRLRFFRRRIRRYRVEWKKNYYDGLWADKAFDVIEDVYPTLTKSSGFVQRLLARFDCAAELTIKKELNNHLSRFFYLNELFFHLSRSFNSRIAFVPSNKIRYDSYLTGTHESVYYNFFKKLVCVSGIPLNEHRNVSFFFAIRVLGYMRVCVEILMRHARMMALIIKTFFHALKNSAREQKHESWKYAVMIIATDRQFQNDIEGLDFLIDGSHIKKEEVVFIPHHFVRLGKREIDIIEKKKLNYIHSLYAYYSFGSWADMVKSCVLLFFTNKPFFLKVAYALCAECALWKCFSKRVHVDNVIGNHDVSISALCRNIILEEKQGTRSWLYQDSYLLGNYFAIEQNRTRYKSNFYSFMKFSYIVCWNKRMERIFSFMHNNVGEYYQAGCLWSTFIKRRMITDHRVRNSRVRTIAVFDSSYHDYSMLSPRCAYFFYKGILRLLDEMKDVRIIMKPKKRKTYYENSFEDKSMLRLIDMLAWHKRCEVVDCSTPRCEIIVQADLVVAFPFTSPAFEAVCAGVPAIYFDATEVFPDSVYHGFGMIASNYRDLSEKVKYFLAMPQADFYQWRQENQSFFDGFLDGWGLDRFIEKLSTSQRAVVRSPIVAAKK